MYKGRDIFIEVGVSGLGPEIATSPFFSKEMIFSG